MFSHIDGNCYHYDGNNPVKYTDPTGAFTVDNENQTIICDFFGAIYSLVDLLIDGVGFPGPAGGYISIGLKYTKQGVIFGITQFARGQIELEKCAVNKWSESMFGVRFK